MRRALEVVSAFLFGFLAATLGGWFGIAAAVPIVAAAVFYLTDKETA